MAAQPKPLKLFYTCWGKTSRRRGLFKKHISYIAPSRHSRSKLIVCQSLGYKNWIHHYCEELNSTPIDIAEQKLMQRKSELESEYNKADAGGKRSIRAQLDAIESILQDIQQAKKGIPPPPPKPKPEPRTVIISSHDIDTMSNYRLGTLSRVLDNVFRSEPIYPSPGSESTLEVYRCKHSIALIKFLYATSRKSFGLEDIKYVGFFPLTPEGMKDLVDFLKDSEPKIASQVLNALAKYISCVEPNLAFEII